MEKKPSTIIRKENTGGVKYSPELLAFSMIGEKEFSELKADKSTKEWVSDIDLSQVPKGLLSNPVRIYYEITRRCNLRCKQCFNGSGNYQPGEQSLEEVFKTLEGLRKTGVIDMRFTGGELTQREDWFDIVQKSKQLGFITSVNTNGVYKDHSTIDKLLKLNLDQITVSLDGDERRHNFFRGKGVHDKLMDSLYDLSAGGAHIRINSLLFKNNTSMACLADVVEEANYVAEEINFFFARPFGRARNIDANLLTYEDMQGVNKKLMTLSKQFKNSSRFFFGEKVKRNKSIMKPNGLRIGAPDGFTVFNVNYDGSIFPGGYAEHANKNLYLGNIKEEGYSINNIWYNNKTLEAFRQTSEMWQKQCGACKEYKTYCSGHDMELIVIKDNRYCPLKVELANPLAKLLV